MRYPKVTKSLKNKALATLTLERILSLKQALKKNRLQVLEEIKKKAYGKL